MENQGIEWLTAEQVATKIGFSKVTLYRFIKDEGFPQPVKIGQRSRWIKSAVEEWMLKIQDAA